MGELYGFAGKTLHVDLTTENVTAEPLPKALAETFLGGVGISSWLAYTLITRKVDPLSPDNALVFGVSPLAGTLAPASSRVHVNSRSPDSGFLCYANAGHSAGLMMKYAGYDHLVITGKAESPVYLQITDDEVAIRDANHLWGRDTWETTDLLQEELRGHWVDCIGPSAENLVGYSIISCSKRSSFNKTGPGTVMGSKNLKAIAARGTNGVEVADPARFQTLTDAIVRRIVADPELRTYRVFGGPLRERPGYTRDQFVKQVADRPYACLSCPVACKHLLHLRGGPYEGLRYRISHLVALAGHNSQGGPEDWNELVKLVEDENRYGIEASVTAATLNYLVGCYENGILTDEEIGFVPKRGGAAMRALIQLVVRREGIGDLASKGLMGTVDIVSEASEQHAKHHKGVGREHRLDREVSLFTIGSLTNPRGGKGEFSHIPYGNGNSVGLEGKTVRRFCSDLGLQQETTDRVCTGQDGFNVSGLLKWVEDYSVAYMSLGFCNRSIIMRHITLETMSQLYEAATGLTVTPTKLLVAGERAFNVLKAFNVKMGASRRDDLPSRGATWPADKPLLMAGRKYGTLNQILDQYYNERGWDVETGVPTRRKLTELGLQRVADDLGV